MRLSRAVLLLPVAAGFAAAQPVINNVFNAASFTVQGLPNSALAQGSIFTVQGDNMGPTTGVTASPAFQSATLDGSSISVTVGSTTVNALMYYASAGQLSALLPSNTPTGSGTMTVTYQGSASSTYDIQVANNNIGIFTISENGGGVTIATYPDYSLVSSIPGTGSLADTCPASGQYCPYTYTGAALPGDVITLWGTGLGPVSGGDSTAGLGQTVSVALTLWIGGVSVPVSYQGRSGCCIGEDQIQFTMPSNVPTGCAVPVLIQIGTGSGSLVSNNTFMPIGNGSRSCTPSSPSLTSSAVQALTTATGPIDLATVQLGRELNAVNSSGVFYEDYGIASFGQYSVSYLGQSSVPTVLSSLDSPPPGTCGVFGAANPGNPPLLTALAGSDPGTVTLSGPIPPPLSMTNKGGTPETYEAIFSPYGTYFTAGQYTFAGGGGRDIGKFSTNFSIVAPAPTWNESNTASLLMNGVTRANGLTVTWTPGSASADYNVYIGGSSYTSTATASPGAAFQCLVPASAGTFTVPPSVLLALPSGSIEIDFKPALIPQGFTAPVLSDENASTLPPFVGFMTFSYQTSIFPALN